MATIKLEIVSPDKVVYENDISMLIVRSTGGELGILPHHAPLVAGLVPHAMRIRLGADRDEQLIAVAGGFMEVTPEKITVLATAAEQPIGHRYQPREGSYGPRQGPHCRLPSGYA